MSNDSRTSTPADPGLLGRKVERMLSVMISLPLVVTVDKLAEATGWPIRVLEMVVDAAEAGCKVQRWDENPDGASVVMLGAEAEARGLECGEEGYWIRASTRCVRGRRFDHQVARESEMFTEGYQSLEVIAGRGPSGLDLLISAEEWAAAPPVEDEPEKPRPGRPSDLSVLTKAMASRNPPHPPLNLLGAGGIWAGPEPRQTGTSREWEGRSYDGLGAVSVRGECHERPVMASACPGCLGRDLGSGQFCLRCDRPSSAVQPSTKARRMREDHDQSASGGRRRSA